MVVIQRRVPSANGSSTPRPKARPHLNLQAVVDLGGTVLFTFRGRGYVLPPLPYKLGQELLAAWMHALEFGAQLRAEELPEYGKTLDHISRLVWRAVRPASLALRVMRRVGLTRNPFLVASEAELGELASFILARRTSAGALSPQVAKTAPRLT